jgi:hypothetical protein
MLDWIHSQLDLRRPNDVLLWAAINTAWFFLLRAGEYLQHNGRSWDYGKVLTGADIELRKGGNHLSAGEVPDEVVIRIRGSKTDQYNVGQVRNHFLSGHTYLCVVKALARVKGLFPLRFGKSEEGLLPMFRWDSGDPIKRDQVVSWLERAALAEGIPPERVASHSLRIGGATALYHACKDLDVVRRYGRWSSSAYNLYLWEAAEGAHGVAESMSQDKTTLMATRGLGADAVREAWDARSSRKVGAVPEYRSLLLAIFNEMQRENQQHLHALGALATRTVMRATDRRLDPRMRMVIDQRPFSGRR